MAKKKLTIDDMLVPKEEIPYDVPENWCWVKLGGIVNEVKNGTTIKQNKDKVGPKVTRIESVQNNKIDFSRIGYITEQEKIKDSDWYEAGDIVLSHINSIEHVGKTALIEEYYLPLIHGMNLLRIRLKKELINPKYFALYTQGYDFKSEVVDRVNRAVNQVSLNQKRLNEITIPIPPLAEQERIVNRIESLFDKVDKAVCLVAEAREGFEKRRAAILERAFSGELTKKWREDNGVEFNEEKIALSEVVSINPKKPKLEFNDEQICSFVPMAAVSDVNGKIEAMEERPYAKVKKGYTYFEEDDVLFAKITPCMENGKACIAEGLNNRFGFGTTEFHVLRCGEKVLNKYLYYLVRAKWFREEAKQYMTGAVGQQRVPKTYLEDYEVLIPSIEEQEEVVRLLEYMLDKEFEVEYLCDIEDKVELLKKSILSRAFRGELGSNNLNEESSIELLKDLIK